jgi:hypothetical protein
MMRIKAMQMALEILAHRAALGEYRSELIDLADDTFLYDKVRSDWRLSSEVKTLCDMYVTYADRN